MTGNVPSPANRAGDGPMDGERPASWVLDASRHVRSAVTASGAYGPDLQMDELPLVIDATSQPGASPDGLAELHAIDIELLHRAVILSENGRLVYERDGGV